MKNLSELLVKYRHICLAAILAVTAVFGYFLPRISISESEETYFGAGDSTLINYQNFQKSFEKNDYIIVAYEYGEVLSPENYELLQRLSGEIAGLGNVEEVVHWASIDCVNGAEDGLNIAPLIDSLPLVASDIADLKMKIAAHPFILDNLLSSDYRTACLAVKLPGRYSGEKADSIQRALYVEIKKIAERELATNNLRLYLGGDVVTDSEIETLMEDDISLLFPISLVLCAIVLFFFFKGIVAIVAPLLIVVVSIVWVLGMMAWTGSPINPISTTIFPLVTVIGIATYAHLQNAFVKCHLSQPIGTEISKTASAAISRVIKPCTFATLTTAAGFGSLITSSIVGVQELGMYAAYGIISSFLISLLTVPTVFMMQKRISANSSSGKIQAVIDRLLVKIGSLCLSFPKSILLGALLIFIICVIAVFSIKTEGSLISYSKKGTTLRQDIEYIDGHLSGVSSFELILKGEPDYFKQPQALRSIQDFQASVAGLENVRNVYSVVDFVKMISRALHSDSTEYYAIPPSADEVAQGLLLYEMSDGEELSSYVSETYDECRISIRIKQMTTEDRNLLLSQIEEQTAIFGSTQHYTTGFELLIQQLTVNLVMTQIESLLSAMLVIQILMVILFGVRVGLVSMIPNIFPLVFFMGVMGLAGLQLNIATSIIAAITIGIVVDDTVHFFFEYQRNINEGYVSRDAIFKTFSKVGSAMIITTLIISIGFSVLIFSQSKFIMEFGMLSSLAMIVALLCDLLLSPVLLSKMDIKPRLSKISRWMVS